MIGRFAGALATPDKEAELAHERPAGLSIRGAIAARHCLAQVLPTSSPTSPDRGLHSSTQSDRIDTFSSTHPYAAEDVSNAHRVPWCDGRSPRPITQRALPPT